MNQQDVSEICFEETCAAPQDQTARSLFARLPHGSDYAQTLIECLATGYLVAVVASIRIREMQMHVDSMAEAVVGRTVHIEHRGPRATSEAPARAGWVEGLGERSATFRVQAHDDHELVFDGTVTLVAAERARIESRIATKVPDLAPGCRQDRVREHCRTVSGERQRQHHRLALSSDTSSWTTSTFSSTRLLPTMTTLADGRVLLAGGAGNGGVRLTTAEVYNPDANVWTAAAAMSAARRAASAVLLDVGSVLEVGGFNSDSLDSVERYAPWPVGGCRATYLEAQLQKTRGIGHYFFQTPSPGLAARLRAVDVGARQPKSLADGLHWSSRFSKERTRNLPFIRGVLRSFLEDLVLQRLLAKHALKLGDLGTSGCQLRGRHHSLASRYGRQRLLLELAPLEQQADGNAFLARDERHAHARFIASTNQRLRRWSLNRRYVKNPHGYWFLWSGRKKIPP
jgi:fluoroacetyl-CoA thioesterase